MSGFEIPAAMAIAGAGASATGSIMRGREEARAAAFRGAELTMESNEQRRQAEETRIAATQAETRRRDELQSSLETIAAMRAGRGVGAASPTGMAILTSITEDVGRDIDTERYNFASRAGALDRSADMSAFGAAQARKRGKTALLAGYLGAAEAVLSTGTKLSRGGRL